jgi:beta-glucosidase
MQHAFRNPDLPVEQRVDDLVSRLTIEEKISQLMMGTPAIPRLGIPAYDWWNEALHGVARNGVATVYPQAIALAATWNPDLHFRVADSISTEARAKHNDLLAHSKTGDTKRYQGLTIWSPNINIFRDPRWGRGQETYGEDPFLTAEFGNAFIRGLQGDNPRHLKTVATVKHFAVHSGPEPLRHRFNAIASERDIRETYLPAFEAGIVDARAWSLMSAYNAINGIPAPAHHELLTAILRDEWKFEGAVVSDVGGISDIWRPKAHLYTKDAAEASAAAIKAGNELASDRTYEALPDALKRGLITEAEIDNALRRLLKLLFMLGHFDPPELVSYRAIPISENASDKHDQLALEAARQSLVLLKNDGTLPLDPAKLKTVAILGPTGFEESTIIGNYAGTPRSQVTLADGIRAKLEARGIRVLAEPAVPLVKGFRVTGNPIPEGVLFTDASRKEPGLKLEIFSNNKQDAKNPNLVGTLVASQTQTRIDLQWDETQPAGEIPIANASLRWTGVMVPPGTGEYVLGIVSEGAVRLYIDDKRVIDFWRRDPERPLSATVSLNAGQSYNIRIEYVQLSRKGRVQLGWIAPGNNEAHDRAMAAARASDHIILTLGLTPDLEGESMSVTAEGFSGGDRLTIQLPQTQRELIDEVSALGKSVSLVLTGGSAIAFDDTKANAVLLAWYYGQRGADAVADALLGDSNPSGRLPVTFYKNDSDLPPFEDYSMANRTYRYFPGKPLYAFGHGLSYTTFAYTGFSLSAKNINANDTLTATITLKNTGARDGDEVVQIYAAAQNPPVPMPLRQLAGFKRVTLKAGETRAVEIAIPAARLRRWDTAQKRYVVDPGDYIFTAGPASDKPVLTFSVIVK